MDIRKLQYKHPLGYQRLLMAGCAAMVLSGVVSMTFPTRELKATFRDELALPLPVQERQATAKLTRLPGRDGSTPVSALTVAQPTTPTAELAIKGDMRSLGRTMNALRFGDGQFWALDKLWTRESNWNPNARNRSSGACGVPQALPCSKIPDMSPEGQISWGLGYIAARYGTPSAAWSHSQAYGWY